MLLLHLWNAPNTLLGLVAGLGGTYTWRRADGTCEVVGGWFVGLLSRGRLADAITLGDVILYADAALPAVLRDHEMVHVRQYRLWGPLFLPAYGIESLYQWARTGDGYRQNRFEQAAYGDKK
jgi:hypothetical protein